MAMESDQRVEDACTRWVVFHYMPCISAQALVTKAILQHIATAQQYTIETKTHPLARFIHNLTSPFVCATMNTLLDLVLCGQGTQMCGGTSDLFQGESNGDFFIDKLCDAVAVKRRPVTRPPIPEVIEVSLGSEDDDEYGDLISTISEADMIRAFTRCRDMMACSSPKEQKEFDHELRLLEIEAEDDDGGAEKDDGSLACSSFDSRMGDSRFMVEEDEVYNRQYDDGSSYGSYYFRQPPKLTRQHGVVSTSWQTTSTRATENVQNPRLSRPHNLSAHRMDEWMNG